ncbi:hypothetical protein OQ252_09830 [Acetobacter farinalis]|uniref:Uncharacterized protein n=1 Tax=Acetobacter farinalis TaxID=1260984 RepID=A0ABT3Q8T9_9PROT|nr:hypothetical protein [Acetobacter farinalis]MCX2561692.1 hypothetical protein [Acetobacter farinalis]NHO30189.1 hypothetical protein [Acetobacter farinalis]
MTLSDDASLRSLAQRFLDQSLPKSEWTHAGHLGAALWLTRHRPDLTAPDEIRACIMRYNEATQTLNTDTSGYHHTITLASMRAVSSTLEGFAPDTPLHSVLKALLTSPFGHPDWLFTYWTRGTLFSVTARKTWVAPDIMPLPF